MLKRKLKRLFTIVSVCAALCLNACGSKRNELISPAGYDLGRPFRISLPEELNEISGIVYYPKDTSLFAVSDEFGLLYKIKLHEPANIKTWNFWKKKDFEDLALVDSVFYFMTARGHIIRLNFSNNDSMKAEDFRFPSEEENEFETLYYDEQLQRLVLICKKCKEDSKNQVSSYSFAPADTVFRKNYIINTDHIRSSKDNERIKPSAAAIHPETGELFILCSINKLLLIADRNGVIKQRIELDTKMFKQPEGMCFAPDGGLFISNEAAEIGAAEILYFRYTKQATR